MRSSIFLSCVTTVALLLHNSELSAEIVTFGTGGNAFTMEFVEIGNPGNAGDTTGWPTSSGSVAYTYQMGKHEVSEDMINK